MADILKQYVPDYTDVNVEVISIEGKRLEITIWADDAGEEDVVEAVTKEIEESEYSTNQLFFTTTRH